MVMQGVRMTKLLKQTFMKAYKNEDGNIIIIFAMTFMVIIAFVTFSTDIAMAMSRRSELMEIGQIMREVRFEQSEVIWNSDNPEETFDKMVREYGKKNGLSDSQINTKYEEIYTGTYGKRTFNVDITLTDSYECTTLSLFGINNIPIKVTIKGYAEKSKNSGVWRPGY